MSTATVYLGTERVRVSTSARIGTGGEADVFALDDHRALKLFKGPDHIDIRDQPVAQDAARERLRVHQRKLVDFPTGLPARVVAPQTLATTGRRRARVVGYAMPLISGADLLYRYAEPRYRRRGVQANHVVDILADLHTTIHAIHAAGVVIGDFNDLNVLVREGRAYVIDADSFQYGGYPCQVYTERFVDPLLCRPDASAPVLVRAYGQESDWYAFTVMVMRSLLCVGPYGGVYRPRTPAQRIPHSRRPLARVTVFDPEVVYPRPATPYDRLPDDVLAHLHDTFVGDVRAAFPGHLLDEMRWARCLGCGVEHARTRCPACTASPGKDDATPVVAEPELTRRGHVTARELCASGDALIVDAAVQAGVLRWLTWDGRFLRNRHDRVLFRNADGATVRGSFVCRGDGAALITDGRLVALDAPAVEPPPTGSGQPSQPPMTRAVTRALDVRADDSSGRDAFACNGRHSYWLQGGQLRTQGVVGPVAVGRVLRQQTRIWMGEQFGFGVYRVGAHTVGFVFQPGRRGLNDEVAMPMIRGTVLDMHCHVGDSRAWLVWTAQRNGQLLHGCACVHRDGHLLGTASRADHERDATDGRAWLASAAGACAAGPYLMVPTDDGVARVEVSEGRLRALRSFPDTAPFVDAGVRLAASAEGLLVVRERRVTRLSIQ